MKLLASGLPLILTGTILSLAMVLLATSRLEYCGQPEVPQSHIHAAAAAETLKNATPQGQPDAPAAKPEPKDGDPPCGRRDGDLACLGHGLGGMCVFGKGEAPKQIEEPTKEETPA